MFDLTLLSPTAYNQKKDILLFPINRTICVVFVLFFSYWFSLHTINIYRTDLTIKSKAWIHP